jgi:hypothetical protein
MFISVFITFKWLFLCLYIAVSSNILYVILIHSIFLQSRQNIKGEKEKVLSTDDFRIMVFNATFNNISVISWQSVFLVEETGVPG